MKTILFPLLATLGGLLRSRTLLHLEILALRQQLAMVKRTLPHVGGLHHEYRRAA